MKNFHVNWDALGIGTSLACAVHCALFPLFLTSLPVFGINIINNLAFEIGMIALALGIGLFSLYHGYRRHHHRLLPMIIFLTGFAFLVLKQFFARVETWLLIPAVIMIVTAHFFNFRFCRIYNHAHAEDCDH